MDIQSKLVTIEEFEAFADAPENADRRFELFQGEIIEMTPTQEHGNIVLNIGAAIKLYLRQNPVGRAGVEIRHRSPDDEHTAVQPDVSFVRAEPDQPVVREGIMPQLPDLAVEVKSPSDAYIHLRRKAEYYLEHGCRMVWLVFPGLQMVEVYEPGKAVQLLKADATLDGGEVLPGFSTQVADIFEM